MAEQRHHGQRDDPDSPPDRDPRLLTECDQRLAQRQRQQVDARSGGEHGEIPAPQREVGAERDAHDRRPEGPGADGGGHAERADGGSHPPGLGT